MNYTEIEEKIGYIFADKTLLERAFTLSSYAKAYGKESNERMEFLGDAVLELIISEKLYAETQATEGDMTAARKGLVQDETLKKAVERLDLQAHLKFSGTAADNLGKKPVASLFEAIVAAIYLDGGYEKAKQFAVRHLEFQKDDGQADYISKLKEFLEERKENRKSLTKNDWKVETKGKDNDPEHTATIVVDGQAFQGTGKKIKQAQQSAAKKALEALQK